MSSSTIPIFFPQASRRFCQNFHEQFLFVTFNLTHKFILHFQNFFKNLNATVYRIPFTCIWLYKKGVPSAVGFPHCAGSGEGLSLSPKPYPHKCTQASNRKSKIWMKGMDLVLGSKVLHHTCSVLPISVVVQFTCWKSLTCKLTNFMISFSICQAWFYIIF